jgi:hypothetical protein
MSLLLSFWDIESAPLTGIVFSVLLAAGFLLLARAWVERNKRR